MQLHLASVDSGIVIFYRGHTILYVHIRAQVYHTFEFALVPHIVISTCEFWHAHSWRELETVFLQLVFGVDMKVNVSS